MGSVGVIRDITLRRKSEEMLRKLYQAVDQLTAGVLVADHNFRVEYVNPGFFRISGLTPQDVIGAELFSFFEFAGQGRGVPLPRTRRLRRDEVRLAKRRGVLRKPSRGIARTEPTETGSAAKSGPPSTLLPCGRPGAVTHAILICEDISQRKAMEELVAMPRTRPNGPTRRRAISLPP